MDISEIKSMIFELRRQLYAKSINVDLAILFGSYAAGHQRQDSDIDIAIVSRDLGKDRFEESVLLNSIASRIDPRLEIVPVGLEAYLQPETISPILHEIKEKGTPLF